MQCQARRVHSYTKPPEAMLVEINAELSLQGNESIGIGARLTP